MSTIKLEKGFFGFFKNLFSIIKECFRKETIEPEKPIVNLKKKPSEFKVILEVVSKRSHVAVRSLTHTGKTTSEVLAFRDFYIWWHTEDTEYFTFSYGKGVTRGAYSFIRSEISFIRYNTKEA
jgi:hypothetical protein